MATEIGLRIAGAALFALISISGRAHAQTGDSVVDSYVGNPYYEHKAGNKFAPLNLAPSNYGVYGFQMLDCAFASAPVWEGSCPSDLSYAPNVHTGGYQAFGVGYHNIQAQDYWDYDCYYVDVWVWDQEAGTWVLEWQYWCDYHHITVAAELTGVVVARVSWGGYQADLGIPLSTSAFKGTTLPPCNPTYTGPTAPCSSVGTYVAGAGYEDKVLITDQECALLRTGLNSDHWNGCLHPSTGWISDLPSAYGDTTASDSSSPLVVGMGTPYPATFEEGRTYTWVRYFGKAGNRSTHGDARHNGAVTKKVPESPFCIAFSSTFGENAACYFNVDQTQLAPASPF
jgi:hypothetical protein